MFRYGLTGKPELSPIFMIQTCASMCRILTATYLSAIARNFPVGIDIEMIRSEMDIQAIAERFFSSAETEQLRTVTGLRKREGFFNGWTRKEAYLKARGEGIGDGLGQFAVSLIPGKPARLLFDQRDPAAVGRWSVRELAAEAGLSAALVVEAVDFEIRRLQWEGS